MPATGQQQNIIIVGGGPAGLMAADILSASGCKVTLYDRMPSPGRKFLLAGRGGLNLTHSEPLPQFLQRYGPASDWLTPFIRAFAPDELRAFASQLGQPTFTGSSGRVFPESFKTSPLLRAWLRKLAAQGVETRLRHEFTGWNERGDVLFTDAAGGTIAVQAAATILAMGGASWPRLGSDGGWTAPLAQHHVEISPLRPANCGFDVPWPDHFAERFAGMPLKSIAAERNGLRVNGECVITRSGLEGGLIYAFAAPLRDALAAHGNAQLRLDLKPSMTVQDLAARLQTASEKQSRKQSFSNRLRKTTRLPPQAIALLRLQGDLPAEPRALAQMIKNLPVALTGIQPVARAISTAGGVSREALDDNLMLKAMPGVFAAGEMLDWEAPTGGYLLQACFATGAAAAHGAMRWLAV